LRDAVAAVEQLADRLDDPLVGRQYAAALEFAVAHDAWDADRRAVLAAERLGLHRLSPQRRVSTLSGGERSRLALATAITGRPDALLLDEPTNHLDDDALDVLAQFLRDLPGALLFASHDRVFLDEVATDLIDLNPTAFGTDGMGGRRFGGGWTAYDDARRAARERWEQAYADQKSELTRLREAARIGTAAIAAGRGPTDNDKFIHAFKGQNVERTLARRRRSAHRRLAAAQETQVRKPPRLLRLNTDISVAGNTGLVATLRDVVVPARLRLPRLDVRTGEHLLVTGVSGAGKSTLLGILSGRIRPAAGTVHVRARQVGELMQDPVFGDLTRAAQDVYRDAVGDELATRRPLSDLGLLHPRDLHRPVGALSVGQRRRLALAMVIATGPDLLLLDEPTNHLSLALADELEQAIGVTPGAVVLASHDRWLRGRWVGSRIELAAEGRVF
jgi:macrolide transport system ATP-binding/permease protein